MNLVSSVTIKNLCEKYEIRPSKKWGQNFLIDRNILEKIIKTADLKEDDVVLEIGPGFGVLTQELASRVKKVYAVEIDRRMVEALKENLLNYENIEIINEDILKVETNRLLPPSPLPLPPSPLPLPSSRRRGSKNYKVVANLPYQITSAIIRKFLENKLQPELMVLMVQKEVAERICTKPGDMSLLSISVQFFGVPKIISKVSRNSFWPVPKIDSAILEIIPHSRRDVDPEKFFKVVRAGFSNPRKQLKNNLGVEESVLEKVGLNKKVRAEELSVEEWVNLTELVE